MIIKLLPEGEVLIFQSGRFGSCDDGIAGQTSAEFQLIFFNEILYFPSMSASRRESKIALEMVKCIERIVQFIIVNESEPVMNLPGFGEPSSALS